MTQTHVVVAGHGSRAPEANAALRSLADALASELAAPVAAAYLEMTEPAIPASLDAAVAAGATRVVVVPYFLSPGMHVRRDLVEIVDDAAARHPSVVFDIAPFLGSHPEVPRLLADLARGAL